MHYVGGFSSSISLEVCVVGIMKIWCYTPPLLLTVAHDGIASYKWHHNAPSVKCITVLPGNDAQKQGARESKLRHTCYS